jgi:hypothetical protein
MIDLTRTRAEFLAEIEAPDPGNDPWRDITDPRTAAADPRVHVYGHGRGNLRDEAGGEPRLETAATTSF